jgi:lipid-binding SYLF domain-containing protein
MTRLGTLFGTALLLTLALTPGIRAAGHLSRETATIEEAGGVCEVFAANTLKGIPPALLNDAKGVAIIPHVVRAGLLVDRRFGRGVVLVRYQSGVWSHPLFVTLEGGGIGLEAGVEATDLVLVFKTQSSLDRILKGKGQLTLGTDAAVAVGPIGREAEKPELRRKAEVFSYSHTRGLFAGVSLEGDKLRVDTTANKEFYQLRDHFSPEVAISLSVPAVPAEMRLHEHLNRMSGVQPPPPAVIVPVQHPER